jgi:hypothetical protein
MLLQPSLVWTWNRTIDRLPYLLTGVVLFLVKFAIDWMIAARVFGQSWSLMHYLIWPNDRTLRVFDLTDTERVFALTMLVVSLPFVWIGVILSLHRLRAAGLPMALVVFFFVPLVNLLLFLVLTLLPTQKVLTVEAVPAQEFRRLRALRQRHRRLAGDSHWRSGLVALLITVPIAVLGFVLGAEILQSYGFSLFIGGPFALGMISVLLFGFSRPQPFGACIRLGLTAAALTGLALLALALEGVICLIMATPIVFFLTFFGALVGYVIQARPWLSDETVGVMLAVLGALPGLMAAETVKPEEQLSFSDRVETVVTTVVLEASLEQVWDALLVTDDVSADKPLLLQIGPPIPKRCTLEGTGVGATRTCHFDLGIVEERVTGWDPPFGLHMQIVRVTLPGRHWLRFERTSFVIEGLAPNKARVTRATTISSKLRPAWYWRFFERMGIEAEHEYVFESLAVSFKPSEAKRGVSAVGNVAKVAALGPT